MKSNAASFFGAPLTRPLWAAGRAKAHGDPHMFEEPLNGADLDDRIVVENWESQRLRVTQLPRHRCRYAGAVPEKVLDNVHDTVACRNSAELHLDIHRGHKSRLQ